MPHFLKMLFVLIVLVSCGDEAKKESAPTTNWENKKAKIWDFSEFHKGKTYLPLYSHIYHIGEERTFDLTATVSIRNVSTSDTAYILKVDYYNTVGKKIRQYLKEPVYLKPMETIEIIIDENDSEGGSGANFMFEWAVKNEKNPPLFEAVMISTYGQQGLSFTTRGEEVFE